ncbi:hypothetical protein EVAR_47182_1 [Eumeta japonica]|uniref:Uncharacterized protein n=1 Tax=Eumeta variegata TaxID=151549 RepID=A0A4C1WUY2_EUMVA|nr:hypothetical protein EVAR_47182_1 [Eumeta japonica]
MRVDISVCYARRRAVMIVSKIYRTSSQAYKEPYGLCFLTYRYVCMLSKTRHEQFEVIRGQCDRPVFTNPTPPPAPPRPPRPPHPRAAHAEADVS